MISLRLERQRAGDADAARLAAGELVRIAAGESARQADQRQQPPRLGVEVAAGAPWMRERLGDQRAAPCGRGLSEATGSWNIIAMSRR